MGANILVVDDEPKILDVVRRYLERDGHTVRLAHDGYEAVASFRAERPALVVLDLMLPGMDGWRVCRELRRESRVPIVMLTARAEESDRLLGLDLGADDYVVKPFSPRELAARVRAVLRRASGAEPSEEPERVELGRLAIDATRFEATWGGEPLPLTRTEFLILLALGRGRGRVLSRAQLADGALGEIFAGTDRAIDAHVKNLRRKLREGGAGDLVATVRGVGYRLREPRDG
jgi:two-component system, OmpR family, alkaline phosphatase synthesis response regulator PhoP